MSFDEILRKTFINSTELPSLHGNDNTSLQLDFHDANLRLIITFVKGPVKAVVGMLPEFFPCFHHQP